MDEVYEKIICKYMDELIPFIEKTEGRIKWISEMSHSFAVHELRVGNFRIEFLYDEKDWNNPTYNISTPNYIKVTEEFKMGDERLIGIHEVEKSGRIKPYASYPLYPRNYYSNK